MCVNCANDIRSTKTTYLATEEQAIASFTCIRDAFHYHLRNVHIERARPKIVEEEERLYIVHSSTYIDTHTHTHEPINESIGRGVSLFAFWYCSLTRRTHTHTQRERERETRYASTSMYAPWLLW